MNEGPPTSVQSNSDEFSRRTKDTMFIDKEVVDALEPKGSKIFCDHTELISVMMHLHTQSTHRNSSFMYI